MLSGYLHISDRELLMVVDGELSARRAAKVRSHLAACWNCRARMAEIEGSILDFARAYREIPGDKLPPDAGPRALLSAHLAELASHSERKSWHSFRLFPWAMRTIAMFLVFLSAVLLGKLIWQYEAGRAATSDRTSLERGVIPDGRLTPGATRAATLDELCSFAHEEVVGQVNAPLRNQVLKEYGIVNSRVGDYEIDYLIAPGLGGTEDIRNLWPQPYTARVWNAYAKDALEERLHQMVCNRELDLAVAQRDIADDWVAAYKKYFQADEPLPSTADLAPLSALESFKR